jgi:lipoprotein NlpI
MLKWLLLALVLLTPGAASASGVDDANAGIAAGKRHEWKEAIRLYTSALDRGDLPPATAANVHNNRGIAYTRIEQGDKALADFNAAITLNPRYENAYVNRGDVLHFKGQYEKAIAEYDAALKIERDDDVALFDRGNSYAALGQHQKAIADYDAAIRLNGKYQPAYFNRGNSHQALGRYNEAIVDYDMAIKLKPDDGNAHAGRGYINFFLGHYAAAAGDFQHGASEDPYRAIWRYLARARSGENDTRELALNTVVKENRALWPGPVIAFYLGQVTQAQVLAAAAQGDERKQREKGCEASFYLGEYALIRLEIPNAQRFLRKAQETCPSGFVERIAAEAELKRVQK